MGELDKNWPRVLSVWWCICWRAILGALFFGILAGVAIGAVSDMYGLEIDPLVAAGLVALPGALWLLLVVRLALRKHYRQFRIALVPLLH